MQRLTESAAGLALLALTFLLGLIGLVADLTDVGDPPAFFGAAVVAGLAAIGVALDEGRRAPGAHRWREAFFGRVLVALALALGAISVVLALQGSAYRNLWLVLAVIVDLVGAAVILDSHRLFVARSASLEIHPLADAILGMLGAALALACGVVGFLVGLADNPHAPAWLAAGVVLALLSLALMFDEQAHVIARARGKGRRVVPPRS